MSFDYPDEIFPHPAVEYIPISLYNAQLIKNQLPSKNSTVEINIFSNLKEAKQIINAYQLPNINTIADNELLVIALGSQVNEIKYRSYKVIMVGTKSKELIHIFKVKTDYFYKEKLFFILYTPKAVKLATANFNLT